MATIQLGTTKVANKLISYAEKKAVERDGVNCDTEYTKTQFTATRELFAKNQGIQAHHIIQSFKPGEADPKLANKIGKELAEKIAKGHEVAIYTHADKAHIHNHIIVNSVNFENGNKFQLHGMKAIDKVRLASDEICKEHNLSIVKEPTAEKRYHKAEYGLADRGIVSWKDELRDTIDFEKKNSKSYSDFKKNLTEKYGVKVKERGKNITFTHPNGQKVRGTKLGLDYERGTIENGFSRQVERGTGKGTDQQEFRGPFEGDKGTQRTDAELHKGSHEREFSNSNDSRQSIESDSRDQQGHSVENGFDITKARKLAEELRRKSSSSFGKWQDGNEQQQQIDIDQNDRDRENDKSEHGRDEKEIGRGLERVRGQDFELDF